MIPSNAPRIPKWAGYLFSALTLTVFTIVYAASGRPSIALLPLLFCIAGFLIMAAYYWIKEHKSQ